MYIADLFFMCLVVWENHPQRTTTQALPSQHAVGLTLLGNVRW
jgi:hypothetical protein